MTTLIALPAGQQPALIQQQPSQCDNFLRGAKKVAIICLKLVAAIGTFFMNPTVFAIGFIVGIVFDEQFRDLIDKIVRIWTRQKIAMTLLLVVAGFLSLPVTLAVGSFLYAGYLGSSLAQENGV